MATDIGTTIKRARERKRWTQRELADALGVNRKTVDNWENGRTQPASSIGALEEVLGVSLNGEVPDRSPPTILDERLGREDADVIRNLLRDMEPDRAEAIIAGLEERLRRRAAGTG